MRCSSPWWDRWGRCGPTRSWPAASTSGAAASSIPPWRPPSTRRPCPSAISAEKLEPVPPLLVNGPPRSLDRPEHPDPAPGPAKEIVERRGGERIAKAVRAPSQPAVEIARPLADRPAIGELAIRVGPSLRLVVPGRFQQPYIATEDLRRPADVRHAEPIVVPGDGIGTLGIEPAEAKEATQVPVHGDAVSADHDFSLGQVPVRYVEAGIANHLDVVEERGHEVQPALLEMDAPRHLVATVLEQPLPPPGQERPRGGSRAHPQEAHIVDAGLRDVELALDALLSPEGLQQVGRENDGAPAQQLEHRGELADHETFLLQKGRAGKPSLQQVRQQVRSGRVHQLLPRVVEAEAREIRYAEIGEAQDLERLGGGIEVPVDLVREEHEERSLGMITSERVREHAREREKALGHDGGHRQLLHD